MNSSIHVSPRENQFETVMEFEDNKILINLCGGFDRNLAHIEHHLDVQIIRRGNQLLLSGEDCAVQQAVELFQKAYSRIEQGREVNAADLDALLRMEGSHVEYFDPIDDQTELFETDSVEIKTRKKLIEPRTDAQKAYALNLFKHELAFGIGPAGTGKTYLAVAVGVNMLINGMVDRIILSRPAVEAGERLGFLPGTQDEKVDPYMQPLYDALGDFLPAKMIAKMKEEKTIEIAPLAFMRGRTLANAFVVLDEAQNATSMQMKMFLTRLGEGSRMVITGDRSQIDLPRGVPSGLKEAEKILKGVPNISFNYFTSKDVVRHPLVAAIIEAYEKNDL